MHFFYTLSVFIIGLFFILLSISVFLIEIFESLKIDALNFLLQDDLFLPIFGFIALLIGVAIIFHVFDSLKKRYHHVQSKKGDYYLEEKVFKDSISTYWKNLFPDQEIQTLIILNKKNLKIVANLPFISLDKQKDLLSKIDRDLKNILHNQIGYYKPYVLSISFE